MQLSSPPLRLMSSLCTAVRVIPLLSALTLAACSLGKTAHVDSVGAQAITAATNSLAAAAALERLNADLLLTTSATLTLERWCAERALAADPTIVVEHTDGAAAPPSPDQRQRLQVDAATVVKYRNVKLKCGERTLSVAENWYVPSRLTPAMNDGLENTRTPYGKVIRPLEPHRETFALDRSRWLEDIATEHDNTAPPSCDATVFSHSALVISEDGAPLAEVRENYKMDLVCP